MPWQGSKLKPDAFDEVAGYIKKRQKYKNTLFRNSHQNLKHCSLIWMDQSRILNNHKMFLLKADL